MKDITPVIKRTRVSTERYEVCPHCDQEIGEKSTYMDDDNYVYHRPCMAAGPIDLIKPAKIEWGPNGIRALNEPIAKAASYADSQWASSLKHATKAAKMIHETLGLHMIAKEFNLPGQMEMNLHIRKNLLPIVRSLLERNSLLSSLRIVSGDSFEADQTMLTDAVAKTEQYLSMRGEDEREAAAAAMGDVWKMLSSLPALATGSAAPTIVQLANGKFGLRIARSDLAKVMTATENGKATLSKAAVVSLVTSRINKKATVLGRIKMAQSMGWNVDFSGGNEVPAEMNGFTYEPPQDFERALREWEASCEDGPVRYWEMIDWLDDHVSEEADDDQQYRVRVLMDVRGNCRIEWPTTG